MGLARPAEGAQDGAAGLKTAAAPEATSGRRKTSLELIGHLVDAGLAAGFFLRSAFGGAGEANTADRLLADLDRRAALQRNDFRERALAGNNGLGALHPVARGAAESLRRVSFAAGKLDIVRLCAVTLQEHAQAAGPCGPKRPSR